MAYQPAADSDSVMRSAWIKWARAIELQKELARATRVFGDLGSYEYVATDNHADFTDPLVKVHWRLVLRQPYPERWSVLLGDVVTNLRAALDHAFWQAVVVHSGFPTHPQRVAFPIAKSVASFRRVRDLALLVPSSVWEIVETMQPFHGGEAAHTAPLEVLRWLSNVDKHRAVHVVGRTTFDMGPTIVKSSVPLDVVEEWRREGNAEDGAVIARLKFKRPLTTEPVDLMPTFAHTASIPISDDPREFRSLSSAMDIMGNEVLRVLAAFTDRLGARYPDPEQLEGWKPARGIRARRRRGLLGGPRSGRLPSSLSAGLALQ